MLTIGIGISVAGGAIIATFLSWPASLSTFGLVPLLAALLWISKGSHNISQTRDRSLPRVSEIFQIIRRRTILLLLAADAGVMFQYTALSGWLPAFYYETRDMSFEFSGLLASFLPLSGIIGVAIGGSLPLKFGTPRTYLIIAGALVLVAGPGTYMFQSSWLTYIALLIVGAGSWLYLPTLLAETMKAAKFIEKNVAIVWGALLTFTGISMFVAPILVGYIHDVFETFILGFLICSIASSLLLIAGLCMNKRS
jgi:cyanate permease